MLEELHEGNYQTLNLYFYNNTYGRFAEGDHPISDPVENCMMYTSDDCQSRFTDGQMLRLSLDGSGSRC